MTTEDLKHLLSGYVIKYISITGDCQNLTLTLWKPQGSYTLNITDQPDSCENRYFKVDDDLDEFKGNIFYGLEIRPTSDPDVQFLEIATSFGPLNIACMNEHNGYYAGFNLEYTLSWTTLRR